MNRAQLAGGTNNRPTNDENEHEHPPNIETERFSKNNKN